jgi:hypothetical protein
MGGLPSASRHWREWLWKRVVALAHVDLDWTSCAAGRHMQCSQPSREASSGLGFGLKVDLFYLEYSHSNSLSVPPAIKVCHRRTATNSLQAPQHSF